MEVSAKDGTNVELAFLHDIGGSITVLTQPWIRLYTNVPDDELQLIKFKFMPQKLEG